ncbi:MAG: hypothetical protein AVDCRST_MAG59-3952 [uncultured Thermomicrobiales bacterium]|uniref:Uncharacterized protein n=1 Tax=uncultured Thermomicrobiales bacterium TaxID=1645740 RepID=A0A6J4VC29_9BACT|nr:MAG: hypothetical protein AVDCRST_MAG59-3952 [uncultured Thermomicrobiales bacterium]
MRTDPRASHKRAAPTPALAVAKRSVFGTVTRGADRRGRQARGRVAQPVSESPSRYLARATGWETPAGVA